jgi:hypothetical protein
VLTSCSVRNQQTYFILSENTKQIKYTINCGSSRPITYQSIEIIKNDTIFVFNQQHRNVIYLYNLNKEKLDSVVLPKPNTHSIHFIQFNNDSILNISFNMFYDDGDSTFFYDISLNSKKVLKSIQIPLKEINNPDYYIMSIGVNNDQKKWYFFLKERSLSTSNIALYVYDILKNSINKISYQYPFFDYKILESDYFYPSGAKIIHNNLGIRYTYRSSITKIDAKTNAVSEVKIVNDYLDTNFMYSNTVSKYKGYYCNLDYFPSLKIYRRMLMLGYEYGKKKLFAYYDTLFNVIGYQFVPKDFILESNGVFYSYDLNHTKLLLKIHSKPIIESVSKEDFDMHLKEIYNKYNTVCTINQFDPSVKYNKFIEMLSDSIKDKNFKLLVISGTSCPACNIDTYNMIIINEAFFMNHPKSPMYILLLDTANVFYQYKYQFVEQNHIFIDKENLYEVLFSNRMNINPIVITARNRKVKSVVPFDVEDERNSKFLKALFDN